MGKKILGVIIGVILIAYLWNRSDSVGSTEDDFKQFISKFRKSYKDTAEYNFRFEQFKNNVELIKKFNSNPEDTA